MVSFYSFQGFILLVIVAAIVAGATWMLWREGRTVAPALTKEGIKSGFGGWVLLFVAGTVLQVILNVWNVGTMAADLYFLLQKSSESPAAALMMLLPVLAAIIIACVLLLQLAFKRTPATVATAVVMIWLTGPGLTLLQTWYFHLELTSAGMVQFFVWPIVWTAYFAVSPRVALTYGTPRGKRLVQGK